MLMAISQSLHIAVNCPFMKDLIFSYPSYFRYSRLAFECATDYDNIAQLPRLISMPRLSKQSPFASMSEVDSIDSEISLASPLINFEDNQASRLFEFVTFYCPVISKVK